jgi:hypothetical protein
MPAVPGRGNPPDMGFQTRIIEEIRVELLFDIGKFGVRREQKFFAQGGVAFRIRFPVSRIPAILK